MPVLIPWGATAVTAISGLWITVTSKGAAGLSPRSGLSLRYIDQCHVSAAAAIAAANPTDRPQSEADSALSTSKPQRPEKRAGRRSTKCATPSVKSSLRMLSTISAFARVTASPRDWYGASQI